MFDSNSMRVEYWLGSFDKLCLKRKRDMKNTITIACASLSLAVTTFETQADFTQPGFLFRLFEGGLASGGEACNFGSVTQVAANEWFFQGQHSNTIGTSMSWAYLVDPDPFITGTLSLTNETAFSKEYVVDFSLPISPAIAQSTVSGQMSGTLTDANGSGSASLTSTNGGAIYTALADDMFVQSLMSNVPIRNKFVQWRIFRSRITATCRSIDQQHDWNSIFVHFERRRFRFILKHLRCPPRTSTRCDCDGDFGGIYCATRPPEKCIKSLVSGVWVGGTVLEEKG